MRAVGLQRWWDAVRGGRAAALVCLLLALFVLQTAVTRSHFHLGSASGGDVSLADAAGVDVGAGGTKAPTPLHDESHCPLWHAAGVCGAAVAPDAVTIIAPIATWLRIAVDARLIFPERFTAAWRSRAPPSL